MLQTLTCQIRDPVWGFEPLAMTMIVKNLKNKIVRMVTNAKKLLDCKELHPTRKGFVKDIKNIGINALRLVDYVKVFFMIFDFVSVYNVRTA